MKFDASQGGAFTCRGPTLADEVLLVSQNVYDEIVVQGGTVRTTVKDAVWDMHSNTTLNRTADLFGAIYYESLDPAIAVMVGSRVKYVSDGVARINCYGLQNTKRLNVICQHVIGTTSQTFVSWVPGSLSAYLNDAINGFAASHNNNDLGLFSVQDHANSIYVRNPTFWLPYDVTCISPWNDKEPGRPYVRTQTPISPSYIMGVWHYQVDVGTKIRYITNDNQTVERTVTQVIVINDPALFPPQTSTSFAIDRCIYKLDAPLPASIKPALFLPQNWKEYLPSVWVITPENGADIWYKAGAAGFGSNQNKEVFAADFGDVAYTTAQLPPYPVQTEMGINMFRPTDPARADWYRDSRSGDSGHPWFIALPGQTIMLYNITSTSTTPPNQGGSGNNNIFLADLIQSFMVGEQLSYADLSAFPRY